MNCPKCSGLLVSAPVPSLMLTDYFIDTADVQAGESEAVSCVNCGYYADAVTLANRAKQAQEQRLIHEAESIVTWASFTLKQVA